MKVGILTFHNALNFGATLQAYALCEALRKQRIDAEVINYINPKMKKEISLFYKPVGENIKDKIIRLLFLPKRQRIIRSYEIFFDKYMCLSGPCISGTEQLSELCERYEKIVVGSDQIFNYHGTGEDFNFYLDFCQDNEKKVAYAPSFGLREIDETHLERVSNCLKKFGALSCREMQGVEIIQRLTGRKVPLVCDPTFLLTRDEWREIAITPKISKPYVLVYTFGSSCLDEKAHYVARKINGIVVDLNRYIPTLSICEKNVVGVSPAEFLGLIAHAEYILTCSFHGMALAINFEKKFTLYPNSYASAENTNLRFFNLAKQLGLESSIRDIKENPCEDEIDYTIVNEKLALWRKESMSYLKEALGEMPNL